jgi:hypothetical protein
MNYAPEEYYGLRWILNGETEGDSDALGSEKNGKAKKLKSGEERANDTTTPL